MSGRQHRIVISSVTGEPIPWDDAAGEEDGGASSATGPGGSGGSGGGKILPDRVAEDRPAPGEDESHDARILRDVPPHWGRGQ